MLLEFNVSSFFKKSVVSSANWVMLMNLFPPLCFTFTVQLEGFFNIPPIPVGNKTERKGLKFLNPLGLHPFRWKHCNENTGKVSGEL